MPHVYLAAENFSNQLKPLKTYLKKLNLLFHPVVKIISIAANRHLYTETAEAPQKQPELCYKMTGLCTISGEPTPSFTIIYYHHLPVAVPLSLCSSAPVTGCALFGFAPGAAGEGGPAPPPRSMQDGGGGCPRFSNTLWSCWQRNRGGTSRGM